MKYHSRTLYALLQRLLCVAALICVSYIVFSGGETHAANTLPKDTACSRSMTPSTNTPGRDIVTAIFQNINALLSQVGSTMYKGIAGNASFKNVLKGVTVLYVAIYGIMIMLNLVSHRTSEVISRLVRIGILLTLVNPTPLIGTYTGWLYFDQYVGRFFMGGMNELIISFTTAAYVGSTFPSAANLALLTPPTGWFAYLDVAAISAFFPVMDIVFQPFFLIAILGLLLLGTSGFMMAAVMGWAFFDFLFLIIGAIVTYVKSVVGMSFLLGLGPIFLAFMLFHKTRNITFGWINQLVNLALTPIMLFAFLSFYAVLLDSVMISMFKGLDFCYTHFVSVPGTPIDVGWWRPATYDSSCSCWKLVSGDWVNPDGTERPPAINPINIIFFLLLSHLGRNFSSHIGQIAANMSNGIGVSVVNASDISGWLSKSVGGPVKQAMSGPGGKSASVAQDAATLVNPRLRR